MSLFIEGRAYLLKVAHRSAFSCRLVHLYQGGPRLPVSWARLFFACGSWATHSHISAKKSSADYLIYLTVQHKSFKQYRNNLKSFDVY